MIAQVSFRGLEGFGKLRCNITFDVFEVPRPEGGLLLRFSVWSYLRTRRRTWLLFLGLFLIAVLPLDEPISWLLSGLVSIRLLYLMGMSWRVYRHFKGTYLRLIIDHPGAWQLHFHPTDREALLDATLTLSAQQRTYPTQDPDTPGTRKELYQQEYSLLDHLRPTGGEEGPLTIVLPVLNKSLPPPHRGGNSSVRWQLTYVHRPGDLPAFRSRWNLPVHITTRYAAPRSPHPPH